MSEPMLIKKMREMERATTRTIELVDDRFVREFVKFEQYARGAASDLPQLKWLNMSGWDNEPVPERKWAIRDRVPLNQAGLFSGEGGTGKSITELMKNVAHVTGKDWLGSMPEPGPAFYIGAEDDEREIHIRLRRDRQALRRDVYGSDRGRAACSLPARPRRNALPRRRQKRQGRNDKALSPALRSSGRHQAEEYQH